MSETSEATTQSPAIVVDALDKSYGDIHAVSGISFTVERGEMFALVGPDGAGKSTTIRMLCGILKANSGTATLLGFDVATQPEEIKRRIGYLSQRFSLYSDLSVDENIEFFARINGVKDFRHRRDELLEFTRLDPFRTRLAEKLSGGMKQKLALACTLIHTPEIIFLDEPTTGVDPVTRRDFWKLLAELMRGGTTIFLTTPYLDEAERCTHVAMMNRGEILARDRPSELRLMLGQEVMEVICSPIRKAYTIALADGHKREYFDDIQMFGDRLNFLYHDHTPDEVKAIIRTKFSDDGISVTSFRTKRPTLENVFITLMEHHNQAGVEPL